MHDTLMSLIPHTCSHTHSHSHLYIRAHTQATDSKIIYSAPTPQLTLSFHSYALTHTLSFSYSVSLSIRHVNNSQHTLAEHIAIVVSLVAQLKPSNSRRSDVVCHTFYYKKFRTVKYTEDILFHFFFFSRSNLGCLFHFYSHTKRVIHLKAIVFFFRVFVCITLDNHRHYYHFGNDLKCNQTIFLVYVRSGVTFFSTFRAILQSFIVCKNFKRVKID